MYFDLSEEQRILQQSARKFFGRECPSERVRELMETETAVDDALWRGLAEQGFIGMTLPEEYGGLGVGLVELAVVAEEMGRACVPGPFLSTLWAAALIAEAGNDEQCRRYLQPIAEGGATATVALLERAASWDPAAVQFAAEADSDGIRLTGQKLFVGDAAAADHVICAARTGGDLVLAVVPAKASGMTTTAMPAIDRTRKLYKIDFDGIRVPAENVLAVGQAAQAALERSMQIATVAVCAELVGIMNWVLETTVEYAKTREQFGRPIGTYQAVQHQCADMLLFAESARSAAYFAAWALSENDEAASRAVAIAKAYCSDAGREVGNRGVQVHGGIGFTWEHNMHLYYRRAKADEILFGDATFHRERVARLAIDPQLSKARDSEPAVV